MNCKLAVQTRDAFIPEDYKRSIEVMVEAGGRASPSLVNRKLSVPYARAQQYVELAVNEGYVKRPDWMTS